MNPNAASAYQTGLGKTKLLFGRLIYLGARCTIRFKIGLGDSLVAGPVKTCSVFGGTSACTLNHGLSPTIAVEANTGRGILDWVIADIDPVVLNPPDDPFNGSRVAQSAKAGLKHLCIKI